MTICGMTSHGKPIKLTKAQRYFLALGDRGFTRLIKVPARLSTEKGFHIYTVAGLIRRGWLYQKDNGIIRSTDLGRYALQCDIGEFRGQAVNG